MYAEPGTRLAMVVGVPARRNRASHDPPSDKDVFHVPVKRPSTARNPMRDPLVMSGARPTRRTPPGRRARDRREFEPVDVREIRKKFRQTRRQFADMIGISAETLRNWERARRYPTGPARALLRIAAADPDVVAAVLIQNAITWGRTDPFDRC
jgi:putative transcriptional regulator